MRIAIIDGGVVANIIRVSGDAIPSEHRGMPEATDAAQIGGTWDVETGFMPPAPAPATSEAVNRERERRLNAGTVIAVDGYGDIAVQGRPQDMTAYMALRDTARSLDAAGETAAVVKFRDRGNTMHMLTPQQAVALVDAGQAYARAIYEASWAIKDADPIPQDYASNQHWPG